MQRPLTRCLAPCLAALAVLLAIAPAGAGTPQLFGADGSGGNLSNLYVLDPSTGQVIETIGAIGFAITGLAVDPITRIVYGSTSNAGPNPGSLVTIDRSTGQGTVVGSFGLLNDTMADLAFLADGTLVGWAPRTGTLYRIDKASAAVEPVGGGTGRSEQAGLAVDGDGTAWFGGFSGSIGGPGLLTINPTAGAVTGTQLYSCAPDSTCTSQLRIGMGMAFDPQNVLYAIEQDGIVFRNLVRVDPTTAQVTVVGPTVGLLDALAFDVNGGPETPGGAADPANPAPIAVALDIRPATCHNAFNARAKGVLPVAILGTTHLDVRAIDTATVRLVGVAPLRIGHEDVAAPFTPFTGKTSPLDCTTAGPDGIPDVVLHFDNQALAAAVGPLSRNDVVILTLTGVLLDGTPIVGEDVIVLVQ